MENLLKETIECLKENNKTINDVLWVGNDEISFSWDEFSKIAGFEYDNGYGTQNIEESLVVVGLDWWLERAEYDGSEGWGFKSLPKQPENRVPVLRDIKFNN